jgi:ABC-type multidrug transport system ATPase subunit
VGNEYVRGVSGGERKRVSIAETLATKSTVVCWDNSTRGLDASTALDYANSLRVMTDISNRTTFVTLYQAGEGIYRLMDKVLVIEEGRMIYQGPAKDAKAYFQVRIISERAITLGRDSCPGEKSEKVALGV